MNRFKQANQSGHQTESITDLKTAGVAKGEHIATQKAASENTAASKRQISVEEAKPVIVEPSVSLNENISDVQLPQVPDDAEAKVVASVQQQPVNPEIYQPSAEHIAAYANPVEPQLAKVSSQNIPNMFTHKGESKSIRKSLVLRPSSVRTAEEYCAKNGGSFNELIQILLDNFIDEYGL